MKTTFSTLRCNLLAVLLFAATPLIAHAQLTEWMLPAGSHPLQIDASSPSSLVYFVDQGAAGVPRTINRLNPGFNQLTQWNVPFFPTVPGGIVVDQQFLTNYVYVTDLLANTLGQLDVINNLYFRYNLAPFGIIGGPRQLVYDTSYTVAVNDLVWFSASGSAATGASPMIGYFDPVASAVRVWILGPGVAFPGEPIDGLDFKVVHGIPTVYFAVNGGPGGHNSINKLFPLGGVPNVWVWPLPNGYEQPVPIVANNAGEVFRVKCKGCDTVARLRTSANMFDQWSSSIDTTDMFLTLDPNTQDPRFTGSYRTPTGALPSSDLLVDTCQFLPTPVDPYPEYATSTDYYVYPELFQVPPQIQDVPPLMSNLNTVFPCPWWRWLPISSDGPISMDNAGALTWISETAAAFIARH